MHTHTHTHKHGRPPTVQIRHIHTGALLPDVETEESVYIVLLLLLLLHARWVS